jgi:membrane-bound lytic murein transglycosylase D
MFLSKYCSNILVLLFGCCLTVTLYSFEPVTLFSSQSTGFFDNRIEASDSSITTTTINVRTATTTTKTVDSFWGNLSSELQLDHKTESKAVQNEIRKLLADQDKLYSILKAAGPYIYFIDQQRKARGLPAELALIPVIESEFNPNDHSSKGATGLWQLMPRTATDLGIKVRSNYDGRRNVLNSTNAALAYFNDLGNTFKGNWLLAIAAYNCGEVRIQLNITYLNY